MKKSKPPKFVRPDVSLSGLPGRMRKSDLPDAKAKLDPILAELAGKIRRIYIDERSGFDAVRHGCPVQYRPPKRYDGKPAVYLESTDHVVTPAVPSAWVKAARIFLRDKIDPAMFIAGLFGYLDLEAIPPEPPHLVSPRNLKKWPLIRERQSGVIRLALATEKSIALCEFLPQKNILGKDTVAAYESVLLNEGLALSPLFRYCQALKIGGKSMRDIAERYQAEACLQFDRYQDYYLCHWKGFLPPKFEARMQQIHDYLYAANTYAIEEEIPED